jgi:hypothetical protein
MRRLLALIVSALLVACATNDNRSADGSLVGTMTAGQLPVVAIDGKAMRLAPGARIVGANNTSITPNMLPPASRVRYKLDPTGQISHVWLLPADAR